MAPLAGSELMQQSMLGAVSENPPNNAALEFESATTTPTPAEDGNPDENPDDTIRLGNNTPLISHEVWESLKPQVSYLYLDRNLLLPQVVEELRTNHGLTHVTRGQLVHRLQIWGIRKRKAYVKRNLKVKSTKFLRVATELERILANNDEPGAEGETDDSPAQELEAIQHMQSLLNKLSAAIHAKNKGELDDLHTPILAEWGEPSFNPLHATPVLETQSYMTTPLSKTVSTSAASLLRKLEATQEDLPREKRAKTHHSTGVNLNISYTFEIKRHLQQYHEDFGNNLLKCIRCRKRFWTSDDLLAHQLVPASQICEIAPATAENEDGISAFTAGILNDVKSEISWEALWKVLFPNDKVVPPSNFVPIVEGVELQKPIDEEINRLVLGLQNVCLELDNVADKFEVMDKVEEKFNEFQVALKRIFKARG
ncbi:hypothetical protein QBC38DRAFT_458515 [Podospora fimiseda]|uniref:Clr5 domain-containing protein n=1 Tax=Podospora fimiseda TaxID=252190 RepID=A0AAN7GZK0_9PEZI|nr:hypothetical protein QBC38DRAFT_458515 [Podospora fimiseda]